MTTLMERPVLPSQQDATLAAEASRTLSRVKDAASRTKNVKSELCVHLDDGVTLRLPKAAIDLLHHLLTEMARGNAVTLIPVHAELTTQEAADHLNVSRPFLIRLLQEQRIPFRMVGTHRRVKFSDLEAYRCETEAARKEAMQELADQSQELDLGY